MRSIFQSASERATAEVERLKRQLAAARPSAEAAHATLAAAVADDAAAADIAKHRAALAEAEARVRDLESGLALAQGRVTEAAEKEQAEQEQAAWRLAADFTAQREAVARELEQDAIKLAAKVDTLVRLGADAYEAVPATLRPGSRGGTYDLIARNGIEEFVRYCLFKRCGWQWILPAGSAFPSSVPDFLERVKAGNQWILWRRDHDK